MCLVKHIISVYCTVVLKGIDGFPEKYINVFPYHRVIQVGPKTILVKMFSPLIMDHHLAGQGTVRHELLGLILAKELKDGLHTQLFTLIQYILV